MSRARSSVLLLACLCLTPATASAAGIPIRGRILDAGGAPLAKIRVRLVPIVSAHGAGRLELEGKAEPEPVASAESGADGGFRLEAPEAGMWRVIAGGEGLVPQEAWAVPLLGEMDLPAVRLQRDGGLAVRVLGPDGRPVPGARVWGGVVSRPSSPWQLSPRVAVTGADGRAVLPRAGSAALNVRAGASGFAAAERKEVRTKTVDLRLAAGPALPLRVLGADGKPAAGVLAGLEAGTPLGITSEAGLLDLVAPGPLDLLLIAPDGRQLAARVQPFRKGEPQTPRELRLPAAVEMAARVVSAADGRPLAGALVWSDPGNARRTDARGEARVLTSAQRFSGVQAAAVGFLPETWTPAGKPRPAFTFSLQPDLALTGVVVDEAGAPVAGAEITASLGGMPRSLPMAARMRAIQSRGTLVRSGADGRFRWGGLVEGVDIELRVAKAGFAPTRVDTALPAPGQPAKPLRIVLRRGRSAFGKVLGADQKPIAGAQVTLKTSVAADPRSRFRIAIEPESQDTFEAVTGAEGRFDLGNLPTGRYDLTARGRGWAPLTVPNLEVPEGNRATDLGTLVLARGVALEGFVVDAAGKPVAAAEIHLDDVGDPFPFRRLEEGGEPDALSGLDGFFRIEDLRAGSTVDLSASRSGYAPGEAQGVQVPADPPVRITLQAVGAVSGRVVDPDGKAIAGASVHVEMRPRASRGFMAYHGAPLFDQSDAEGNFRIADVIPGPVGLNAQAPGWQAGSVADLEVRGGEEKRGVEIVLSPAAVLEGRVLSPSGRPLPGAEVQLPPGAMMRRGGFHRTGTDGDGHYVLDSLPPGPLTVEATHPDHGTARRQVELRVGENSLDITLEGGNEVSGRVIDDAGTPVAGAEVWLASSAAFQPFSTMSQGDGSFRFAAVADGSYQAGVDKTGFARAERVPVTVDGSSVTGIELRLTKGGAIVGRITGVEIADLARVQVQARGRGMPSGGRVEPDGSYRIDHLGEGEWRVRAELPGTGLYAEGVARLEPGASEARLDLDMEHGLELSGQVRRNGAPVAGEPLFLEGPQRTMGETDADGRFRFQGLPSGSYKLWVGGRSGLRHEETVELQADRDVTIDIPAADVAGRVVDAADGSPLADVAIQLLAADGDRASGQAQSDSRGAFVLRGVAEGTWRVRAQADGYAPAETTVRVDGADPAEIEISLRATEGVTLQVATATGLPPRTLFYVVLDGAGRKAGDGTVVVGEGGRARLSRVPPGSWAVLLLTESAAALEVQVTAPGDAGRVVLPPQCTLRVTVRALENASVPATVSLIGAGGRPFRTFARFGEPTAVFDLNGGATTLRDVPPGTWDVQVTAADGRTWRTQATTAPGAVAEAVME